MALTSEMLLINLSISKVTMSLYDDDSLGKKEKKKRKKHVWKITNTTVT